MINIKGHPEVNQIITQELTLAGIEVKNCPAYGEIEATICGEISSIYGTISFHRAWTYWVVKGMFPLDLANKIYHHPEGKTSVWAGGHCGKLPPLEQASFFNLDGQTLIRKSELELLKPSSLYEELLRDKQYCFVDDPKREGTPFVTTYHINSAAGLLLFVLLAKN